MHSERGAANAPFFVGKFVVIATPQSRLTPCQLPGRGAFWVQYKLQPKSCPRLRGIRAERAQWAMQRGENRAE